MSTTSTPVTETPRRRHVGRRALRRGAVALAAAALVLSSTTLTAQPAQAAGFSAPASVDTAQCPRTVDTSRTLRYGDRGWRVVHLQCVLRSMGYPTVAIDGVFGPNTRRAVVDFQYYIANLDPDGVVGPLTWRALLKNSRVY